MQNTEEFMDEIVSENGCQKLRKFDEKSLKIDAEMEIRIKESPKTDCS